MKHLHKYVSVALILGLSVYLFSFSNKEEQVVGSLVFRIGNVAVLDKDKTKQRTIGVNDPIYMNDFIETKSESRCEIKLKDGSVLNVNENTLLQIDKQFNKRKEKRTSLQLFLGSIWLKVKKLVSPTDEFSVRTPVGVAAVRGTDFKMEMTADSTLKVMVDEGTVDCGEAPMLRDFDTFADWLKANEEAFQAWANKNSGEEFYNKELKEFEEFMKNEEDEFQNFINGVEEDEKESDEWVKTIIAGEKIVITPGSYAKSKILPEDSIKGF